MYKEKQDEYLKGITCKFPSVIPRQGIENTLKEKNIKNLIF